jgi:hypothetical protein
VGAGKKPEWKLGRTVLTRIPEAIAPQCIALIRKIDDNAVSKQDAITLLEKLTAFIEAETEIDF